jgi:acyl carrier protein
VNTAEFLSLAEELVEAEPSSLTLADDLESVGWDSLSNVEFIAQVDATCGITIDAQRLADCVTLGDVAGLAVSSS